MAHQTTALNECFALFRGIAQSVAAVFCAVHFRKLWCGIGRVRQRGPNRESNSIRGPGLKLPLSSRTKLRRAACALFSSGIPAQVNNTLRVQLTSAPNIFSQFCPLNVGCNVAVTRMKRSQCRGPQITVFDIHPLPRPVRGDATPNDILTMNCSPSERHLFNP